VGEADLRLPLSLANLLPETHLSEIGQQLKVSPQDVLGLLMRVGRDTSPARKPFSPNESWAHG